MRGAAKTVPLEANAGSIRIFISSKRRGGNGVVAHVEAYYLPTEGEGDNVKTRIVKLHDEGDRLAAGHEIIDAFKDRFPHVDPDTTPEQIAQKLERAWTEIEHGAPPVNFNEQGFTVSPNGKYARKDGRTYGLSMGEDDGPSSSSLLVNAIIDVVRDSIADDGDGNIERSFTLDITLSNRHHRCVVPAKDFQSTTLSARLLEAVGPRLLIEPGVERRLPHAILSFGAPDEVHERQHLGWFLDDGGRRHYLDADGDLLTTDGADATLVSLPSDPALRPYHIRRDVTPQQGWDALQRCLSVAPTAITVPLFAQTYLSALLPFLGTSSRVMVFLLGATGARKTELAKLAAGAFGNFQDGGGDTFVTWGATYGSWEAVGHALKDSLYVLDDYKKAIVRDEHVTRFIQHYSTSSGRQRRRSDMTALPSTRVRGNILATGEDAPELESSLEARLLKLPVAPGDVCLTSLTAAQMQATDLHGLTVGFVRWIGEHGGAIEETLPGLVRDYRSAFIDGLPRDTVNVGRVAENLALLQVAWHTLATYAQDVNLISAEENNRMAKEGHAIILKAGVAQASSVDVQAPDRVFLDMLQSLLDQGEVMLTREITEPGSSVGGKAIIGHILKDGIALFSGEGDSGTGIAAYRLVQEHLRRSGTNWPHSWNAVGRYLKQSGKLAAHDSERVTIKRTIGGDSRRVVLLHLDALILPVPIGRNSYSADPYP